MLTNSLNLLNAFSAQWLHLLLTQAIPAAVIFLPVWLLSRRYQQAAPKWQLFIWNAVLVALLFPINVLKKLIARPLLPTGWLAKVNSFWQQLFGLYRESLPIETPHLFGWEAEAGSMQNGVTPLIQHPFPWAVLLILIWFCGAAIIGSVFYRQRRYFQRLQKNAPSILAPQLVELTKKWRLLLKINRSVAIKKTSADVQPFTIGWLRPVIILPNKIIEANNPNLFNSIVAHEMAHIQHADDLWLRLQAVLQAVFFFHPCVWIANRQLTHFRECACDQRVLQHPGISPEQYGTSILAVLRMALSGQPRYLLTASFMSDKHQLKHRFHLLKGGCRMNLIQKLSAVLVIILIAVVALPLASQQNEPTKVSVAEITEATEFQLPLTTGKVSAPFGPIQHPIKKKIYNHTGIDIAAKAGTPIFAAADGTVIEAISDASTSKGWGLKVVIQHAEGYQTAYGHMQSIDVAVGQQVKAGETIAAVGNTGVSTGPHLHFEIRENQEPQNPQDFLDFSPLKAK